MNVSVSVDLAIPALEKHWRQMQRSAQILTDDMRSVRVSQAADNPKRLTVVFTVPNARQGDVVDRIGREFWNWVEDYRDSSIGFAPARRRTKGSP